MTSAFIRKYNAFSGVDIRCFIGDKEIGILQGLSYQVSREMAPIYTMGNPSLPKKKPITGSLVFVQLDPERILYACANDRTKELFFTSGPDDLIPTYYSGKPPWYPDDIPEFDIVMTVANEYGAEAQMKILDVKLLNDGKDTSVDDIVSEKPYTYTAGGLIPWTSISAGEITFPPVSELKKYDNKHYEDHLERRPDDHEGMIQNPITGEWRWF